MIIEKQELLKSVRVCYSEYSKNFYSNAELEIDGYTVKIENKSFPTIDQALSSIKERIKEAILKFDK